jgi:hypothetical protein
MMIRIRVVKAWQRLTPRKRRILRRKGIRSGRAACRLRCEIILGLVQGESPT